VLRYARCFAIAPSAPRCSPAEPPPAPTACPGWAGTTTPASPCRTSSRPPKNSDVGGYHIALYVDDIKAAKDCLDSKGVKTFLGPFPVNEGPAADQSIVYFLAPWGLQWRSSLPERNGLREIVSGGAVGAARSGELIVSSEP